jgi:hypothetical protein
LICLQWNGFRRLRFREGSGNAKPSSDCLSARLCLS